MSDNVTDLQTARFARVPDPAAHETVVALRAAIEWIESLDEKPTHIIISIGRSEPDGGAGTRFFQAGSYNHHGQMGLCLETMQMIRESGETRYG